MASSTRGRCPPVGYSYDLIDLGAHLDDMGVVDGTEARTSLGPQTWSSSRQSPRTFLALRRFPSINANQTIMSIAAGVTTQSIEEASVATLGDCVMPNLPALVGEGISVYAEVTRDGIDFKRAKQY